MNKLNLRLANIAFRVWLAAEKGVQKHWKTDEEVYSVSKWQRYLDNAKKRPKVHPTVVPDEVWQEAKKLKSKMKAEGKDWKQWQKAIEKKFSPEELKRKNVYDTFGVDEKWNAIDKNKQKNQNKPKENNEKEKQLTPSQQKAVEKKKQQREDHKKDYIKHHENGTFSYGGKVFDKIETYFDDEKMEEEFNKIFHVQTGTKKPKNLLTKENENVLKNQLCQFHKERKGNWRHRSDAQLLNEFISKMDPSAYSSLKEYKAAKDRMIDLQRTNPKLGMQIVHSIFQKNDDEEEITLNQQPKTKAQSPKANPEQQGFDEFNNNF